MTSYDVPPNLTSHSNSNGFWRPFHRFQIFLQLKRTGITSNFFLLGRNSYSLSLSRITLQLKFFFVGKGDENQSIMQISMLMRLKNNTYIMHLTKKDALSYLIISMRFSNCRKNWPSCTRWVILGHPFLRVLLIRDPIPRVRREGK